MKRPRQDAGEHCIMRGFGLCRYSSNVTMIKKDDKRADMWHESGNAFKILIGKPEGKMQR
jgi:hypothetical protein